MAAKKVVVICLVLAPLLFLLTAYLLGWLDDPIKATVAESIGTYRGTIPPYRGTPPGEVTLIVYEDGTWDYLIKDKQEQLTFSRAGNWKYRRTEWKLRPTDDDSYFALDDFEFGFGRYEGMKVGWHPLVQRNNRGIIEICFLPTEPVLSCLRKIGDAPTNRN